MAGHRKDLRIVLGALVVSVLAIPFGASASSPTPRVAPSATGGAPPASTPPLACHGAGSCPSGPGGTPTGSAPVPETFEASRMLAWSETLSEAPPGTLGAGSGLVADASADSAIAFGGAGALGLSNATLSYSESTNAWTTVATTNAPGPRSDFGFGFDPTTGEAVLFGGLVNRTSDSVSSGTWTYSVAGSTWTNVSHAGPAAREDPAFAIDPALGIGLMYGGENPNYESDGAIIYSDLWELNLSTFAWTEVPGTGGAHPAPLEGAALAWDPSNGEFQMFGGCAPCSDTVWEFDPVSEEWSELPASANAPAPVAGASWTYDPTLGADLVYGGSDGTTAENGTAIFYPGNDTWVPQSLPGPGARWSAASAYLDESGNATWLVAGGATPGGPTTDLWRLSATSDLDLWVANGSDPILPVAGAEVALDGQDLGSTDAEGYLNLTQVNGVDSSLGVGAFGYFTDTSTLWLAPGSSAQRTVVLTVVPSGDLGALYVTVTGAGVGPIDEAYVSLTLDGTPVTVLPEVTGPTGTVIFPNLPPGTFNLSVSAADWRSNTTEGTISPVSETYVTLQLYADPLLTVTVWGDLPEGGSLVPLYGVTLSLSGITIGASGGSGTLVQSTAAFGPYNLTGEVAGYAPSSTAIVVPWTGDVNASLVLVSLPPGSLTVLVFDASSGQPLDGGVIDVDSSGPLPSGYADATLETSGPGAAYDGTLLEGYYEVTAYVAGYYPATPQAVHILPGENSTVFFSLTLNPDADISFLVRSAATLAPIPGANVSILRFALGRTDLLGFFNVTQIPPGVYDVTASAPGYLTNTSVFLFTILERATVPINLTPLAIPGPYQAASLFGSASLWPLLLVPAVLAVGGVLFTTMTRSDRSEEEGGSVPTERRPSSRAPPPASPT